MGTKGKQPVTFYDTDNNAVLGVTNGINGKLPVTAYDTDGNYVDLSGGGGTPSEYLKSIVENPTGVFTITDKDDVETLINTNTTGGNFINEVNQVPVNISDVETEILGFDVTATGNYTGTLNLMYEDATFFNEITFKLKLNSVTISERSFATIFDVGASSYSLSSVIEFNAGDRVTIDANTQTDTGIGVLSNISGTIYTV